MTEQAITPDKGKLEHESTSLVITAKAFQAIATTEEYDKAVFTGLALKNMEAGIQEFWEPLVSEAHRAHKQLVARREEMLKPVKEAMDYLRGHIGRYQQEQERKRQEEERKAAELLRQQQEEEALAAAQKLAASGDQLGADHVLEQAINAPPPVVIVPSSVPQIKGTSSRQNWTFRVVDESKVPREYLSVDMQKIGQVVRALRDKARIPGIEVIPGQVVSFRS